MSNLIAKVDFDALRMTHALALQEIARLQTAPPQRKPLTEEEIVAVLIASAGMTVKANDVDLRFARAIEAKHGIGSEA